MALISYTGKNVLGIFIGESVESINLLPGINEIDDEKLALMKQNKIFQSFMKNNKVQIMMETAGKDGKRSIEDMLSYIPKIMDIKLLKKIIDTDGRDKVTNAAKKQLESIKNPTKDKDESDEHFV